jgi:hypothetical protein
MAKLTVTARVQATFTKYVLCHRGIQPGQNIKLSLLPEGRGMLEAAQTTGAINCFIVLLEHRTKKVASLEEINEVAARAWASKV